MLLLKTMSIILLQLAVLKSSCQEKKPPLQVGLSLQDLLTTHGNQFKGASFLFSKSFTPKLIMGLGAEFSYAPYHEDNGWDLSRVHFFPFFADEQFHILPGRKLNPIFHLSEGISLADYFKKPQGEQAGFQKVREQGFYAYAGTGLGWKVSKGITFLAETGIKGFHISMNSLDVNPHGVNGRLGILFTSSPRGKSLKYSHSPINKNTGPGHVI
ncbi:MAG: hypothetical protein GC171_11800 [Terrimonas sp.]|nr:hypothetical protein [Terrimonas sp.]